LSRHFIGKESAHGYGLGSLYDPETKKLRKEFAKGEGKEERTAYNNAKVTMLARYYGETDRSALVFRKPSIKMAIEAVPVAPTEDAPASADERNAKTILRIHIFDARASKHTGFHEILRASRSSQLNAIRKAASKPLEGKVDHLNSFLSELNKAAKAGLIEVGGDGGEVTAQNIGSTTVSVKGGFKKIKDMISREMPSIIYGSQNSAVKGASLKTLDNSKLASALMSRRGAGKGTDAPTGMRDDGIPLRVDGTKLSIETFGCPLIRTGQQFFIDFGTGTTADNIYTIKGYSHQLSQGQFETSIDLMYTDGLGEYEPAVSMANAAIEMLEKLK
jgi:hypothetical protein